jgi:lipopolysaccharide transport protein LptA
MKLLTALLSLLLAATASLGHAAVTEIAAVPGEPPTVITSAKLEMDNDGNHAWFVFSGEVRLTGNNLVMTCDRLEIRASRVADLDAPIGQLGRIRRIIATGNVIIEQEGRRATAGRAEVLPLEDRIVVTENPVLTDNQGTVSGERMVFLRGERRAIVEGGASGPARVTLPTLPNLGFPRDDSAAQPPPAQEPVIGR